MSYAKRATLLSIGLFMLIVAVVIGLRSVGDEQRPIHAGNETRDDESALSAEDAATLDARRGSIFDGSDESNAATSYSPGAALAPISGIVVSTDGAPIAGAIIRAAPARSELLAARVEELTTTSKSESDGTFSVTPAWRTCMVSAAMTGMCGDLAAQIEADAGARGLRLVLEPCASIGGTVFDPEGRPLADAVVSLRSLDPSRRSNERVWRIYDRTAKSDAAGRYILNSAPPGAIGLIAKHADYSEETRELMLAIGETATAIDFTLSPGLSISGRVLDETGAPIAGARIECYVNHEGESWHVPGRAGESASDGEYEVRGLDPGRYQMRATHIDHFEHGPRIGSEGIAAGTSGHDLVLHRGGTLAGRVLAPDRAPFYPATVHAGHELATLVDPAIEKPRSVSGGQRISGGVEADGAFTLRGVPTGTIGVYAIDDAHLPSLAQRIELRAGEMIDGLDLVLRAGAALHGHVRTRAGEGIAGAEVRVSATSRRRHGQTVISDADGAFAMTNLVEGAAVGVSASAIGFSDPEPTRQATPGAEPITITLDPAASVRGHVLVPEGLEVWVRLTTEAVTPGAPRAKHIASTVARAPGSYEFPNLPAGRLRISAEDVDGLRADPIEVEILAGEVRDGVDVTWQQGGVITGIVLEDGDVPVGSLTVTCHMHEGNSKVNSAITGDDGTFKFEGLAAGEYLVYAEAHGQYRNVADRISAYALGAHVVLRVTRNRSISGRVIDDAGSPVTAFVVMLSWRQRTDAEEQILAYESVASHDGEFEMFGVRDEGVSSVAIDSDGFAPFRIALSSYPKTGNHDVGDLVLSRGSTIAGHVRLGDGSAVLGAVVEVGPQHLGKEYLHHSPGNAFFGARRTTSNDEGAFVISEAPAGRNWLRAAAAGQQPHLSQIDVSEGASLSGLTITLLAGASVTGIVQGPGHQSQAMQTVTLRMTMDGEERRRNASTDAAGRYQFTELPAGEAMLSILIGDSAIGPGRSGGGVRPERRQSVTLRAGEESLCDFPGWDACRLHGRVLGLPGDNVNRDVEIHGEGFDLAGTISQSGEYEIQDVPPGNYRLEIHALHQGEVQVPVAIEHRLDIELASHEVLVLVQRTDGGSPKGAIVRLRHTAWPGRFIHGIADDGGRVSIGGLAEGAYQATADLEEARLWAPSAVLAVSGDEQSPSPLELILQPAFDLLVRVIGADGLAQSRVGVSASCGAQLRGAYITDATGIATIRGLLPGAWEVVAHSASGALAFGRAEIGQGEPTPLQLQLKAEVALLTLHFRRGGRPVPTRFTLSTMDGPQVPASFHGQLTHEHQATHGTIRINLPPGQYLLLLSDVSTPTAISLAPGGTEHTIELH